ncbi:MAG: ATP-binding protein [Nitrospinales bacterium]
MSHEILTLARFMIAKNHRGFFFALILAFFVMGLFSLAWKEAEAIVPPLLNPEEKDWLKAHPDIKLAPDPFFLPIEYFDEQGRYIGIAADFVALLEKKLGIEFNIVRLNNWDEVLEQSKARQVDMWGAATPTPQRLEYMLFTEPFIELPAVIIVRNQIEKSLSLKELEGMNVAVISGYGIHDYLLNNHPEIKLAVVPDISMGLKKVSFGMVDALIANVALATYYIEKDGISNLRVAGKSDYVYRLGFATRKDWPVLNRILQKGIYSIDEKEKIKLYEKWVGLKMSPFLKIKDILIPVSVLLGVILVLAILIYNRLLKRQVKKRTQDLQKELGERKRVEKELIKAKDDAEKSNNAKSEFLARMSHELRTPLNAILGFTQLLDMNQEGNLTSTEKEKIKHVLNSGEHLLELVNEVLDLSQIEKGRIEIKNESISIKSVIDDLVVSFSPLAKKKGITIENQIPVEEVIYADKTRFKQIMLNLLSNAIKYNKENGFVFVNSRNGHRPTLEIMVRDTGRGIPKDKQIYIFEPFRRLTDDPSIEGTGIGLSITKSLVEYMNGSIAVKSEVGMGSSFSVTFPKNGQTKSFFNLQ